MEQFKEDVFSYEEHQAMEMMKSVSYYCAEEKRWYTSLLWKTNKNQLGCNYQRCLSVLKSVEKGAIHRNTQQMINEYFQELVNLKFAEHVSPATQQQRENNNMHYIPCHAVYRPDRDSMKCRMVMNCSSKTEKGVSLNDLLYTGPLLLPDYVKILIQFRLHAFAFTTDISKMFLQIKLSDSKEMDLLRFLWRDYNSTMDPIEYRMNVLVFGAVSSPFQAIWCVKEHATMHGGTFPLAKLLIAENLYMDDVASSCESIEDATNAVLQLDELFSLASMETHKWASNVQTVLSHFPSSRKATPGKSKVFGQSWDTDKDILAFKFCDSEIEAAAGGEDDTKRTFLKTSASIFDPIGLLGPFTLAIKLLFQQLWALKLEWDEKLPIDLQKIWTNFKKQILLLSDISIPRSLTQNKKRKEARLVVFCDSSLKAYAACVYLVIRYIDGSTSSSFAPLSAARPKTRTRIRAARRASKANPQVPPRCPARWANE